MIKNFAQHFASQSGWGILVQDRDEPRMEAAAAKRQRLQLFGFLKSQIGRCFSGTGFQTLVEWDADPARPPSFNGEFDSGSERTLAAWIRHASRTGFLSVARQEEV